MVFFIPEGKSEESEKAKNNFEQALKRLDPPGSFVTAQNIGDLKQTLRRGIRQKLTYQILKSDMTPVSDESLDVTAPGEMDQWSQPLPPGIYTLRVHADTTYDQKIDLKKGDWMIVDLVNGPDGGIGFQRALYGDSEEFRNPARREAGNWRLAVLANKQQRTAQADRLQIFAALERKHLEPTPDRIAQIRPRFAWFHLGAEDVQHPEHEFSVRWHERIFYPGPVWHFDVPQWINNVAAGGPAKPALTAWWRESESELPAAGVFSLKPPGNTVDLPRECRVEGHKSVTIESIGIENHPIDVWPDTPTPESCLVVRLAFPKDSPYIVDPNGFKGLKTVGYEHRLYNESRKYTGLFWPVNQDELEKLSSLSLISLNALQGEAAQEKNIAEIKLSQPRPEDQIPDPRVPVVKAN